MINRDANKQNRSRSIRIESEYNFLKNESIQAEFKNQTKNNV